MPRVWRGLLLAVVAVAQTACGDHPAPVAKSRLIVIGFDGLDPKLTEQWMADGQMPEFARLRDAGYYQRLPTSNPPQSPVAWASFATGTGAGEHGIFDFLRRDPLTYHPDFSIARYTPPENSISLGQWELPLGDGLLENQRHGEPFWLTAEHQGQRATVQRVPVTYPPDAISHMIAGMGVPDLRGTQGTYTLYSTRRIADAESGGRVVRMSMSSEGRVSTELEGPSHPLKPEADPLTLPLEMTFSRDSARIQLNDETRDLAVGQWTDWWPVRFSYGLGSVPGMVRMHLSAGFPRPILYVSPIQADPLEPVLPLSSPPEYVTQLAERIGRFHTLGMPEETWSLNQGHLEESAYLDMVRTTLAEGEAMLYDSLAANDSELVVKVFVQPDRVSHMFWRGFDPEHPLYAESSELARGAIPWIYRESDRVLAEVRKRMGPEDRLVVLSDHGFASFRRAVNVNRWLMDKGYLQLKTGKRESAPLFADVDWSKSRAYALGLNGLFLNMAGRESQGIVSQAQRQTLLAELSEQLADWRDENGQVVVQRSFLGSELYHGAHTADAPDMVLGYAPGYRASWQTTLGAVPTHLIDDNRQFWSGDHCIDPAAVPGVLFTSFSPSEPIANIAAMAQLLLQQTPPGPTQP